MREWFGVDCIGKGGEEKEAEEEREAGDRHF